MYTMGLQIGHIGLFLALFQLHCVAALPVLQHHITLKNGVYDLFWGYDEENIVFEVQVLTQGYVGLGFSPNGGMTNADIVIGWVKDGKTYLTDRHATGKSSPVVDDVSDVTLLSGSENATHTTLRFSRKLNTCDKKHDRAIGMGTTRLIWAYHETDPDTPESVLHYHTSGQRGAESINLIAPNVTEPPLPDDVITEEFVSNNTSVPSKKTTYWCSGFKMPKYNRKHHMIKVEPVIQPGHESLVHHILLFGCVHAIDVEKHHGTSAECYTPEMPNEWNGCATVIGGYAIGGKKGVIFPDHVGFPLGREEDFDFAIMEMHYDNPDGRSDFVDSSGFRLYLTPTIREYDASMLMLGATVHPTHLVPPHYKSLHTWGQCPKQCLEGAMANSNALDGIKLFSGLLHTHVLGRQVHARHFRNGVELPWILYEDTYDFNFQQFHLLEEERTILPGDELVTDCTYRSDHKTNMTYGGLATEDEMCLAFFMYYPAINLTSCTSSINPKEIEKVVGNTFQYDKLKEQILQVDWKNEEKRDSFQTIEKTTSRYGSCLSGRYHYPFSGQLEPIVKFSEEYTKPDTCTVASTEAPTTGSDVDRVSVPDSGATALYCETMLAAMMMMTYLVLIN